MSGASRCLLAFSNFLTFLVSLPFLASAMLIHFYSHTNCSHYLEQPLFAIGIVLFVVSFLGMIGSCCRVTFMFWFYQWLMFLLIFVLLCFTVMVVVEVHSGSSKGVPGEGPRLQQFSDWLQMNVVDRQNWLGIRACLSESHICPSPEFSQPGDGIYPPIKNGCCKPPAHCGYKLKNGTVWTVPSSGLASRDHDCIMWSSEPNTLCYDCESCKAGVLSRIQKDWWRLSIVAVCLTAFLIINFMVGCCAFRSSRAFDEYQRSRYKS